MPGIKDVLKIVKECFWAMMLPVIIFGGIFSGAFTANEAVDDLCERRTRKAAEVDRDRRSILGPPRLGQLERATLGEILSGQHQDRRLGVADEAVADEALLVEHRGDQERHSGDVAVAFDEFDPISVVPDRAVVTRWFPVHKVLRQAGYDVAITPTGRFALSVLCLLIGTTIWAIAVEGYFWGKNLSLVPRWGIGLAAVVVP